VGRVVGVGVAVGAPLVMGVGDGVGVRVATDAVPPGPLHAASETVTAASRAPPATSNFIIDRIPSRKSPIRSNANKRACGDGVPQGSSRTCFALTVAVAVVHSDIKLAA
jgi:hypothetical protein